MKNSTYLGIDMGTSAIKLVLIDDKKKILCHTLKEYSLSHPQTDWSEIDPGIWYEKMIEGLQEIFLEHDIESVKTIGVTGQMHTLVLLDEKGEVIRPALMWNDKRTRDMIPELKQVFASFPEGTYLSHTISTGSPASNLYWMSKKEPENLSRCRHFLIGPDYLVHRLTGAYTTDYCEASTSCLFRIDAVQWSEEVREFIGISKEIYPELKGSAQIVGNILPKLAEQFGFSPDVTVIAGTGDNPATAISTGCLGEQYPVLSLGTSGVFMMPVSCIEDVAKGKIILFSSDNKTISCLVQGVVQSNGDTVNWWAKKILDGRNYNELLEGIDIKRAMRSDLLFYPHINGDKTIYADSGLRGAFIGLSSYTTEKDMFFAVIEGLCLACRQLAEEMHLPLEKCETLKVVGGGAGNPVWMQILSDVMNKKIEKMEGMIGPPVGIALLAQRAGMQENLLENITEGSLCAGEIFIPDPEDALFYQKKYEKYLRIYDALQYINDGTLPMNQAD